MKPEDLKRPFLWQERSVLIEDRIWHIPEHYGRYESFQFPGWQSPLLFGNDHPVKIEYCSGNGAWVAAKAEQEQTANWVALEKKFPRIQKIWSKMKNRQLQNLFAVCGEAYITTAHYFPEQCVHEIFINFPDPWPKKKHAKHRLIQPRFLDQLYRILILKGQITIVTDDPVYSDEIISLFQGHSGFSCVHSKPYYIQDLAGYGTSYFEELWRGKGKQIRYHQFVKL